MSNIEMIIEERAADIGNFLVGRLLPFSQKRSVGPFVFIDHMGPAALKDYENMDVPPHPPVVGAGAVHQPDRVGRPRGARRPAAVRGH